MLQHAWAEFEHDIRYKGTIPDEHVPDFDRRFTLAAGLLELADREFSTIRDRLQAGHRPSAGADVEDDDPRISPRELAAFLAGQYADAGWSRTDHYAWISGLLLELGITSLAELGDVLRPVDADDAHRADGLPLPARRRPPPRRRPALRRTATPTSSCAATRTGCRRCGRGWRSCDRDRLSRTHAGSGTGPSVAAPAAAPAGRGRSATRPAGSRAARCGRRTGAGATTATTSSSGPITGRNSGSRSMGETTQSTRDQERDLGPPRHVGVLAEGACGGDAGGEELRDLAEQAVRQAVGEQHHQQAAQHPQREGDGTDR